MLATVIATAVEIATAAEVRCSLPRCLVYSLHLTHSMRSGGRGGYDSNRGPPTSRAPPPPVPNKIMQAPAKTAGTVFDDEKLKKRAKSMLKEWEEQKDEKELALSMEETLGTPDAGKKIMQEYAQIIIDAKASEVAAMKAMLVVLYKKKLITSKDVKAGMDDIIEFIDGSACDQPKIYDYVGGLFCAFANVNAYTIEDLCEVTAKVFDEGAKVLTINGCMNGIGDEFGPGATQNCFAGSAKETELLKNLLGEQKVNELKSTNKYFK